MTPLAQDTPTFVYPAGLVEWLDEHDVRYEVIDGMLVVSPSGATRHARGITRVVVALSAAVPAHLEVFTSELDVYDDDQGSYVTPDASVVRPHDLGENGISVAPLLVVEVLSPSTSRKDRLLKREIYAELGVPTYLLLDPLAKLATVLTLRDGVYEETARGTRLELTEPYEVVIDLG